MSKIVFGDCRGIMERWAQEGVRVQMCVTSPPYFGLRDYGVAGQMGLEKTPDEYVRNLVETFRIVWELLADDGLLWLNLGDTYAANRSYQVPSTKGGPKHSPAQGFEDSGMKVPPGLKSKDLIGIPWRVAFALQADGWYLRQDIIWAKPNPMPESVRDRCTKSHEYIFMLSKAPRYYYDGDAICTPCKPSTKARLLQPTLEQQHGSERVPGKTNGTMRACFGGRNKHAGPGTRKSSGREDDGSYLERGANKRDVWWISTKPYKGAHFATFPADLIEPCILAGSRPGDIVLDPCIGSGTTAQVAKQLGRGYLGCELNPAYRELICKRLGT